MNKENTAPNPLGTLPIPRLLVRYAVPSVISMLVMSLYNIVDQIFIGHSPAGYLGNAATTVAFPLVTVMLALSLLIGNGSAAFISLQMGKGNTATVRKIVGNAVMLLVVVGVALGLGIILFLKPLMSCLGATELVMPYALQYTFYIALGTPFAMLGIALSHIIRADGSPRYSMFASLAGVVLNIILAPIFIFPLGMGVRGAAIATVLSQMFAAAIALYYVIRRANHTRLEREHLRPDLGVIRTMAAFGSANFMTQLANTLINVIMNNALVHYGQTSIYGGEVPLSAMGIVMKISAILISTILGIAIGAQPILGYNYGAGNFARVRRTYLTEIAIATTLSTVFCLLFIFTPGTFIRAFGDSSAAFTEFASMALSIFLCFVFTAGVQIPSAIYSQAVGKPLKAMALTLTRQVLVLVPFILILPLFFGLHGILYAGPVADVLATLLTGVFILREMRRLSAAPNVPPPEVKPAADNG